MSLKRITACVLCLILAMALTVPASAEDLLIDYSNPVTRNVPVYYDEPETFTFSVAPSFSLAKDSNGNLTGEYPVSISARLQSGSALSVSIEDRNNCYSVQGQRWCLTGTSSNIYYTLTSRNPSNASDYAIVANGTTIMRCDNDTASNATRNLEFMASAQENQNIKPGNYEGTLTFVISKTN